MNIIWIGIPQMNVANLMIQQQILSTLGGITDTVQQHGTNLMCWIIIVTICMPANTQVTIWYITLLAPAGDHLQ